MRPSKVLTLSSLLLAFAAPTAAARTDTIDKPIYLVHGHGAQDTVAPTDSIKIHPNMTFESAPDGGVS